MAMGGFVVLMVFVSLIGLAVWVIALVDALRRPTEAWADAGQNQLIWVGVIVFANFIGAVLYWLIARPALENIRVMESADQV